jgi:hypothetical protein
MTRKTKKNPAKYLFIIILGMFSLDKLANLMPSYAIGQSGVSSSTNLFQQADILLANGDIQKSILILDTPFPLQDYRIKL